MAPLDVVRSHRCICDCLNPQETLVGLFNVRVNPRRNHGPYGRVWLRRLEIELNRAYTSNDNPALRSIHYNGLPPRSVARGIDHPHAIGDLGVPLDNVKV